MCARKSATALALSLERRRNTRDCDVRAARRDGWSRLLLYVSPLCQRDDPLARCTAALRRASRGGLQQAGFLPMRARKSTTASLSPSTGGAARSLATCARRAALVGVGRWPMEAHCASETALFVGARPRSDVPAAVSNKQLSCVCAQEKAPPRALSLSRGGASRALVTCARRVVLVGVGLCPMEANCANEMVLSFGARSRSDVLAAASDKQLSCAWVQEKAPPRRSLPRQEAQHTRLQRARAAPRCLESVPGLWKPTASAKRAFPSVHGRPPTSQPRPPTSRFLAHVRKKKRHRARSLSRGGGAARSLATCAR